MYKYNPLIVGKLDRVDTGASRLDELDDVNTAGTVSGKVLTFQSGTWVPETPAGGGDMLKAEYVSGAGTVHNASRLEGDTLATVQAHNVEASKITSGTIVLARISPMDDSHIPDLETLSYSGTFATGQIPNLSASKTTSGTFGLARIPAVDDARIPDLETLSYGGAFATAQIPGVGAYKIASGTFTLARIPGTLTGKDADKVDGADAGVGANTVFKIPAGIAQGDIFHVNSGGSVVNLSAGTTGHFLKTWGAGTNPQWASVPGGGDMLKNVYDTGDDGIVDNSERLETNTLATVQAHAVEAGKITSGTLGLARIPSVDNAHLAGGITSDKISALSGTAITYPLNADTVGTTAIKTAGVGNDELAASGLDISKFTVGTAGAARIPALPTSQITTGTFNLNRIPAVDDARIPDLETLSYGGAFATAQIPNLPTTKITSGSFNANRIPILPTDRYGSAVLLTGAQSIGGTKTFTDIPILPASNPTADNEAARKAYVDSATAGDIDGGIYSDTYVNTADIDGGTF